MSGNPKSQNNAPNPKTSSKFQPANPNNNTSSNKSNKSIKYTDTSSKEIKQNLRSNQNLNGNLNTEYSTIPSNVNFIMVSILRIYPLERKFNQ